MKRLYLAATAAFLISAGAGAARAYYFTDCAFTVTGSGGISGFPSTVQWNSGAVGSCGGGSVSCCVKIVGNVLYSADGTHFSQQSHHEDTYGYLCGTNNNNPTQSVSGGTTSGWWKYQAKLETCAGVVLDDFGSNTIHVP